MSTDTERTMRELRERIKNLEQELCEVKGHSWKPDGGSFGTGSVEAYRECKTCRTRQVSAYVANATVAEMLDWQEGIGE